MQNTEVNSSFSNTPYYNKYFSIYRIIHNLPIPLASKIKDPRVEFKKQIDQIILSGEEMFEADEK